MTRRAALPGASELFRLTTSPDQADQSIVDDANGNGQTSSNGNGNGHRTGGDGASLAKAEPVRRGTPRQKHDAKITVYVSGEELLAMEQARLQLRAAHDLAVDRGRLVREAVAVVLADFEAHGEESVLVRRLRGLAAEPSEVGAR